MDLFTKRAHSKSLGRSRIITNASSHEKFQNYLKPKLALKLNLLPLVSPNFPNRITNNSDRIAKSISKESIRKPLIPSMSSARKTPNLQTTLMSRFYSELNDYEKEEILKFSDVFYVGSKHNKLEPDRTKINNGYDCEKWNYKLVKGDHIGYRYEITDFIGKGSFGLVCQCFDHKYKENVAVKILKNKPKFHQQGLTEITILQLLSKKDSKNLQNIVKLKVYFTFRNHICLVFELLSISLYQQRKLDGFKGLRQSLLSSYILQIVQGLIFLESISVIHCDLKPENILFTSKSNKNLKIIDFGSACFAHQRSSTYLQSRYYRAPEIIIGIPYSTQIDMWSLGCLTAELYTGTTLLPGNSETEQLMLIVELLGLPPRFLLSQAQKKKFFFENDGSLTEKVFKNMEVLVPGSREIDWKDEKVKDFVLRCLVWDPSRRMTPKQALLHPLLTQTPIRHSNIKSALF